MTISTNEIIDLVSIENLRKWIEYMPECFVSKLDDEQFNNRLVEDRFILNNINRLYTLIEEITGEKPNCKSNIVAFNQINVDKYNEYQEIVSHIPKFDIEKYAHLKLTEAEKELCYSFVDRCTKDNSDEIADEIANLSSFYLREYAMYLLIFSPKSNYKHSVNSINNDFKEGAKKRIKALGPNKHSIIIYYPH